MGRKYICIYFKTCNQRQKDSGQFNVSPANGGCLPLPPTLPLPVIQLRSNVSTLLSIIIIIIIIIIITIIVITVIVIVIVIVIIIIIIIKS